MASSHFLARLAMWIAVAAIAFASFLGLTWRTDALALSEARVHLFDGKFQLAARAFLPLRESWWVGKEAETGLIVSLILADYQGSGLTGSVHRETSLNDFDLPLLMKQQLNAGEYQRCNKLARFAALFDLPQAHLFEAAALIEMDMREEAAVAYAAAPDAMRTTPLGRAVAAVLPLLDAGARCIVRDRHGAILGWMAADGSFHGVSAEMKEYLQPIYLHAVTREAGSHGVRLALDLDLSRFARSLLQDRTYGSIVLLDPASSDVLAAVSDEKSRFGGDVETSPAFEQQLEPASISKLVTTVAAYRAGLDPDDLLSQMVCRGSKRFGGEILYCASISGRLTGLADAMSASCNVAFADLGVRVGWQGMVDELHRFGFDSSAGNPFPLGFILATSGTERQLADLSIGLEHTRITPLHAAELAAVFGNDGIYNKPSLVKARVGYLGLTARPVDHPEASRIVEESWLPPIIDAMCAVASAHGTAAGVSPWDFPAAMKTGTGGTYRDGFHINYIGFAPVNRPVVAFCVRVTGKRRSTSAQAVGRDVTEQLLNGLRARMGESRVSMRARE